MKRLGLVSSILLAAGLSAGFGAVFDDRACANDFAVTNLKLANRLVAQVDSDGDNDSEPAAEEASETSETSERSSEPAAQRKSDRDSEPASPGNAEPAANTSDGLTPNAVAEEDFKHPEMRENWEAQQTAHDKLIIDRFLLGAAVIFAVIAAALLFSLPPKPRE